MRTASLWMLLGVFCAAVPAARAQSDCKAVFDADDKMIATDRHTFVTAPGPPVVTHEMITAGGVNYIQVNGGWRKSPLTSAQLRDQKIENRKSAKNVSCHLVREEVVEGEAARVYSAHSEDENTKSDMTVWISKNKGLPLKQEQDTQSDGTKTHVSVRYSYSNVAAPALQ